jgi:RHH-type proline utilization regulon transcriptional repressor/proline dehydrogenase/delta 1-pyrroline-5-carboxylate dehydrogenase
VNTDSALETRTRDIGRQLLTAIGRNTSVTSRSWWDDQVMAWTMNDPATKVQLFRFIDVLPRLNDPATVHRHLREYLGEAGETVPALVAAPLRLAPGGEWGDRWISKLATVGATTMARKFNAGSTPEEAAGTVRRLRSRKIAFTADLLGEAVITDDEADAYQRTCLELLEELSATLNALPEVPQIDRDDRGPIPRVNLSLKLTSLTPHFDPMSANATSRRVLQRLRPILDTAKRLGAFINVDMEQYAFKDLTYQIFKDVMTEPAYRDWRDVGIVCQAYLKDALGDLESLADWSKQRGMPVSVRLVKGAYWDYEVLHARQLGWPIPVFQEKWATDANFEKCADLLLSHSALLRPAFGSHNVRSLAHVLAEAERQGVSRKAFEIQMLHGMSEGIGRAIVSEGLRLRLYTPYGAMLPGMAYLVRRLLENTSNESFLKASKVEHTSIDTLLSNPEEVGAMFSRNRPKTSPDGPPPTLPPFSNEPPTDFSRAENREAMRKAINTIRDATTRPTILPSINGRDLSSGDSTVDVISPNDTSMVIARVVMATESQAADAVQAARAQFADWSETPARKRANVLLLAAKTMRQRKFDLAAIEVFECGKPWREADGDIAEAIDFCEFYAREMIRLSGEEARDVAGETNRITHVARGVAVIIPPWNFPLAIPCGMTVAALVTGNTVILKPAEQSQWIARELVDILHQALDAEGLDRGVLSYLPGVGETVGAALVKDRQVDLISFTGSRQVGLLINRQAAETPAGQDHVKRVIAEMGGKNAIIVDDDADLDEAVVGILQSAFGYSGQKCSACSRVVALDGVYDVLVSRLTDALRALPIGPADDPDTVVGPVISAEARARIEEYQRIAASEGRVVAQVDVSGHAARGHFVAPMIVADVDRRSRIAQEEVFGPLLAVLRANDLDDALAIANGTEYALTGGLYSRSPSHIERVRHRFRVGNLYINRPITGALVDRQPFGGFKLSGIGTKAGGTDYLREFLLTRVVTENTMRRGFAPETIVETTHESAGV